MNILNKKTIYAIIILLVVLVGAGVVWYFFSSDPETGEERNLFGVTNPFGSPEGGGGRFSEGGEAQENTGGEREIPQLYQITDSPIAGAGAFTATTTQSDTLAPVVRYMDRQSGNVFEVSLKTLLAQRLTNTTIPRVYEAYFADNGRRIVARYLGEDQQTIQTFVGVIETPTVGDETGIVRGEFLPENINEVALSVESEQLAYTSKGNDGVNVVQANLADLSDSESIFTFPYTEWLIDWTNEIYLTTKPSGFVTGYSYMLDGELNKVVEGLGLTINPSWTGNYILYNNEEVGDLSLYLQNQSTGETREIPFHTLPEKCVWAYDETRFFCGVPKEIPSGTYPDAWYQGRVQFTDSIEMFSTETNVSSSLSSLDTAGEPIDVTNPFLGPNSKFLFFTNKRDGTLWSYRLKEEQTATSTDSGEGE